ncbi:sigma-70 family RNA polymerase sigma factor [Candidatus Vidania fulgoroideorum]
MRLYELRNKKLSKKKEKNFFKNLNKKLFEINFLIFSNKYLKKIFIREIYISYFKKKLQIINYIEKKKKRIKVKKFNINFKKKKDIFIYINEKKRNLKKMCEIRFYEKHLIYLIKTLKNYIYLTIKRFYLIKIKKKKISFINFLKKKKTIIIKLINYYNSFSNIYKEYRLIKNNLLESNIRLVISISKSFVNKGLEFNDLIQEGILGLYKAIDKFEYKKGFKFSTYSTWWIKQSISRSISDHSRIIRIPVHMNDLLFKIKKISNIYFNKKKKDIKNSYISKKFFVEENKIKNLIDVSKNVSSMENNIYDKEKCYLKEIIEDKNENFFEKKIHDNFCKKNIKKILGMLNEREKKIICRRFGIFNNKRQTLEEIGKKMGITRERVRQIESIAIKKLRKPSIIKIIKKLKKGR